MSPRPLLAALKLPPTIRRNGSADTRDRPQRGRVEPPAIGLCLMLLLVPAHHFEPEATDVFEVVCLIILAWHVIGWKIMSRERRAALVAGFRKRHGIPQDQPHKVDSILRK